MTFLLAHLSDAHIGPLPRPRTRELMGKRLTGYVNWRRRGRLHDMAVLARIVDDMHAHAPDHIAMTGDILNIGLPAEFPFARAWLETLGPPKDVSFVPGNHDAYVRSSMPHLASTFAPWVAEIGVQDGLPFAFPYLRRRGPLALIGLSSAIPTAPLLASGALGAEQCAALGTLLAETGRQGLARIVMIHHPPHSTGATGGRGLRDARRFEGIMAQHGAELVIHAITTKRRCRICRDLGSPFRSSVCRPVRRCRGVTATSRPTISIESRNAGRAGPSWRIDAVSCRGHTRSPTSNR